jgi:1,5-anhydro-D-fructose reductase (1,5-anhydro-D-mannitol-forming)
MLQIGIVGFGFMGRMHYRCWKQLDGVQVPALCEADPRALGQEGKGRGNIAGADDDVDLAGLAVYGDLQKMLDSQRLDAISITVPTHLHAGLTIAALEAGLHVLCEKPMALTPADGRRMIDAARRSGKVLQIGHCIRFWPEYAKAKEIVEGGAYGRVVAATFQRLAATGVTRAGTWFSDEQASGGMPLDLHIHDTDFVQYLFGMPRAVSSGGVQGPGGLTHIVTRYEYDDPMLVTAEGGWAMMPGYGFNMRFHIALERATLDFDFQRDPKLRLHTAARETIVPDCGSGDGYSRQIAHFARRIGGESLPAVVTPEDAWNSLRIVAAERESVAAGGKVEIRG